MPRKTHKCITLRNAEYSELKAFAENAGIPIAELTRIALQEYGAIKAKRPTCTASDR